MLKSQTKDKYAIILAAGVGSRLHPITNAMPKSLVKVAGKAILDYQIDGYKNAGLKEENIYIVLGYMWEKVTEHLKKNYPLIKTIINSDYKTTNNMYSLYLALSEIQKDIGSNFKSIFINNADCLYEEQLMHDFINCDIENAVASQLDEYIEESMKITLTSSGNIINIAKNIEAEKSAGVSIDLYKYSQPAIIELFGIVKNFIEEKKELNKWTEVSFPELFKRVDVFPFDIMQKKWVEVDNNDDLLLADKLFSSFDYKCKKAYICDLDGTVFVGDTPIRETINFINNNKDKFDFYYLTNNTSKTPENYVDKLKSYGLIVNEDQIATPLYPLIDYINYNQLHSVYLVANEQVKSFLQNKLKDVSFDFDIEKNQALILTYDTQITYEKLKNIAVLLNNKKIEYIATHQDVFCPTESGPIPDIGSIIQLIKVTCGREPNIILGKPSSALIKRHIDKYGVDNIVIAGDRLYTDKKLADNSGCDFICVLSGETKRLDVALDNSKYPTIVVKNLDELENKYSV